MIFYEYSTISSWHGVLAAMSGHDGTTDVAFQWARAFPGSATERNWSSSPTSSLDGAYVCAFMFDYLGRVQLGSTRDGYPVTPSHAWSQRPALSKRKVHHNV